MQNEKVLKEYDYGTVTAGTLSKTKQNRKLIVTNKRVIHESVVDKKGTPGVSHNDVPVKSVKFVNTSYSITNQPVWIVLAVLFVLMGIIGAIASESFVTFIIFLIVAAVFGLFFFLTRKARLIVSLSADTTISPLMEIGFQSYNRLGGRVGGKSQEIVKIDVNRNVAADIVDELSCLIYSAAQGDFDNV